MKKWEVYGFSDCSKTGNVPFKWVSFWDYIRILFRLPYEAKCPFCSEKIKKWVI